MAPAISGLNHITLAVTDLDRSMVFYRDMLGCVLRAQWPDGAYLEAGSLWLCLAREDERGQRPRPDYTHIAFSVSDEDDPVLAERLRASCTLWRQNRSEGDSTYFLDPDGHRLEVHVGSLDSRLAYYRAHPEKGVVVFAA